MNLLDHSEAEANYMLSQLFEGIKRVQPQTAADVSNAHQIYPGAAGNPCLEGLDTIKFDVILRTRRGTSLILQKVTWKLDTEGIKDPIIERKVLKAQKYDNWKMLSPAGDKRSDSIDVGESLPEDGNEDETNSTSATQ